MSHVRQGLEAQKAAMRERTEQLGAVIPKLRHLLGTVAVYVATGSPAARAALLALASETLSELTERLAQET